MNMKFTSEVEKDDLLAFLDNKVIQSDTIFITSVCRKPTFSFSAVYTNYSSFLPEIFKTGLVRILLFRLFTIYSSWKLIHSDIEHLRSVIRKNVYPDRLIDTVINQFLTRVFVVKDVTPTVKDSKTFQLYLPYLVP